VDLFTKEEKEKVSVTFKTYWRFLAMSKYGILTPILIILYVSSEELSIIFTKFIGKYGVSNDYTPKEVIDALGYLTLAYAVNLYLKNILLTFLLNSSSTSIHMKMISALIRTNVLYFDRTPSGRVLNKFSTDLGIVD